MKSPDQKNSWNQINQFHENSIFTFRKWKIVEKKFNWFQFTSFFRFSLFSKFSGLYIYACLLKIYLDLCNWFVYISGHLTPLPLHNCPVHWDFDQSMWLYPLPDLVVIGDKLDHFTSEKFEGCQVVNPGSFGKNDFTFKTYVPKLKLVEDSQVPEDETS